jgi:hypothetical protein
MQQVEFDSLLLIARELVFLRCVEFHQDRVNLNNCAFPLFCAKFSSFSEINLERCRVVGEPHRDAAVHASITGVLSVEKPSFRVQADSVAAIVPQCRDSMTCFVANGAMTTPVILQLLTASSSTLTSLNLQHVTRMANTKTILPAIAAHCSRLEAFRFSDASGDAVSEAAVDRLASVFRCNPRLRSFEFGSCINDACVTKLSECCTKLRHIKLRSHHITDSGISILANKCTELYSVDITECPLVTEIGIKSLVNACPDLTHLKFNFKYSLGQSTPGGDCEWVNEVKMRYDVDYRGDERELEDLLLDI